MLGVVRLVEFRLRFHRRCTAARKFVEALTDVPHLAFRMEDQTSPVIEVCARPVHHEEVRESWNRDAEVGRRTIAPEVIERHTVATDEFHREEHLAHLESGCENDDVGVITLTIDRDESIGIDVVDLRAHKFDVVALQRTQP